MLISAAFGFDHAVDLSNAVGECRPANLGHPRVFLPVKSVRTPADQMYTTWVLPRAERRSWPQSEGQALSRLRSAAIKASGWSIIT